MFEKYKIFQIRYLMGKNKTTPKFDTFVALKKNMVSLFFPLLLC